MKYKQQRIISSKYLQYIIQLYMQVKALARYNKMIVMEILAYIGCLKKKLRLFDSS